MAHANISSNLFSGRNQQAKVIALPSHKIWHVVASMAVFAEEGIEKLFPKRMSRKVQIPSALLRRLKNLKASPALSVTSALQASEATFSLPYSKKYIDTLSLQRILSIRSGSMCFKRAHFLSIFTNRRAVIFSGTGTSQEEAKFMSDIWYQEWRKEQKQNNIAVKIIEKEYSTEHNSMDAFRCELKVKYAFKVIVK